MNYRHELKHEITYADMLILAGRLRLIAKPDSHGRDGVYKIRSLYFDNLYDKALMEKINGTDKREKFRLRYYDGDPSVLHLEKKSKKSGLSCKQSVNISVEETKRILRGDIAWMQNSGETLLRELYIKFVNQGLRPRTIVDYTRQAFVFPVGNVRVTLDYNIRTGVNGTDFLNSSCLTIPVPGNSRILEVKWDDHLPDIIRSAVGIGDRPAQAFSKYAACRMI